MPSTRTAAVPGGLRATRVRIRTLGPIAALGPPAVLGAASLVLMSDNTSTSRGVLGFGLAVLAAPALLAFGAPLSDPDTYGPSVLASAVFWLLLGAVAAWRATRRPVAGWTDFWREYLWLAVPAWLGVVGAVVLANLVLGQALF
jgi:hypothetical protein